MVGIVKVDTLQNNAGTSSVDMDYVVNGSAKAWVNINGSSGTPTARDSLNVSSITDNNTGRYAPVLTSAMGNTNYSLCGVTNANTGDTFGAPADLVMGINNVVTSTTTTFEMTNYSSGYVDSKYCFGHVFGDLA